MLNRVAVSVVLCTYNRADSLEPALDALLAQPPEIAHEIIVVDNNSTDGTASLIGRVAKRAGGRVHYGFEPTQGLSHARNLGIELADAPIIAFTDDDVRVGADWLQRLVGELDANPDVNYVGGRVLPQWREPPPRWLTKAHWSPLALQDYGSERFITDAHHAICLVGANLAFRRPVFDRVGNFTPELGRIKGGVGSTEDYDLQLRAWRCGMRGMYAPGVVALADVGPDRLVKSYHRRWHRGNGKHSASMRLRELVPADMGPMSEPDDIVRLYGSPAYVYADVVVFARLWLRAVICGGDSFFYSNKIRHLTSYIRRGWEQRAAKGLAATASELRLFARDYWRKRRRRSHWTVKSATNGE